ncbi:hypothetical protein O7599_23940 [Streptomyces sp. WMMC500]|uniref:hypothetical protein n=1 Tax=Streptomyces sp. WMMC500 TaxID=3015154 RepID=UPI00248AE707|nr:hypothetical protein [Streptomyces sp. WMMC500]WBB58662.1 hypothetical protein O7599_23940 [Streptomyces sp. WMMC500]
MLENKASNKRYVVGAVLVVIGAVAVVWSLWLPWYNGRDGRHYAFGSIFDGISETRAQLFGSIFSPIAIGALLALYGARTRSRGFVILAALLVLAVTGLWMFRQNQAVEAVGGLDVNTDGTGLDVGSALVVFGAALMLIGVGVWGRQRRRPLTRPAEDAPSEPNLRTVFANGGSRKDEEGATPDHPSDRPEEPPRAA